MLQQSWLFIIFLNRHFSEASAIDSRYDEISGLQDFYQASSFTDPFQKQPPEIFFKKCVFKNLQNFTGNFIKKSLTLYLKETPRQVFSCGIFDIFKNTYFEEHLRMTASTLPMIYKT